MEPHVRAVFTFAEYEGKEICAAEIPAIDIAERPCFYRGSGRAKGSYVRVGDADLPMTDYEIYHYDSYRKHLHDDVRVIPRDIPNMMSDEKIEEYLNDKKQERPQFARIERQQILEMLNITRNGEFTLAALLNFCIYPQGIFPQFGITAIVVPGYQIGDVGEDDTRFVDNKRIEGTIAEMVDDAVAFCKRNMKVKTIIDDSGRRCDKTEYPVKAIREAVLNALIHRDYSVHTEGTPVQIILYRDRMEIHSPGNLYGRMTVDMLGQARPDLRNPALAVMTESITGAENRYSGIPTIRRELREAGLPAPRFENRRNEFVVTFYNESAKYEYEQMEQGHDSFVVREPVYYYGSAKTEEERILEFCQVPRLKAEIGSMLGLKTSFYVMSKYIAPLLEKGKLAMTIPEKPQSKHQRYYTV